ncbi:MAG TPA: universal stress protein [Thermoanaerobaculia bacterium]|nr:universal stress protein [Thermoanaerobaculia bacterium]
MDVQSHPRPAENPASRGRIATILFATDLSPASERAFDEARRLARQFGAELVIAHAYDPASVLALGYIPAHAYLDWEDQFRASLEAKLDPLVELARQDGIDARPSVLSGQPEQAIVEAAEREGAGMILMGTHGRTGPSRFFLGSVASRVIATAACPVMTVRA